MCGIAGIVGDDASRENLLKMLDTMKHRGHDDAGTFVDYQIALGCDRLSIVDVTGGHQPASNENGTVWAVLNGEVYNHREIRAELQQKGHQFNSLSDTEVLAHAYEEWSERSLQRIKGMFASAIWDGTKKTLVIARDKVGIKPLYYFRSGRTFAFASETKAMIAAGLADALTINPSAVAQILEVGYFLAPMSMFKEVEQLPPASFLSYDGDSASTSTYWEPPAYSDCAPPIQAVRNALKESIVSQTEISDVPVAAFLSGGLDTSTVVAFASRVRPEGLRTFCMGFGEQTDEFKDAKVVAETFGTDHHELLVDASQGMKLFPQMIWHSEMPKVNLYSWFVNEAASRFGKVCLSGLGGDELFCGYPTSSRFKRARQVSSLMRLPLTKQLANAASAIPSGKAKYSKALTDETLAYSTIATGFPPSEIDPSIPGDLKRYFPGTSDFVQEMVRCEFHTKLPYDYLLVEDAMSMAHTLEVRVPLLDDRLLELMLGVPSKYQMTNNVGKMLLRQAMTGILPERCFTKPKWGFSVNVYSWWKNAVRDYAEKYIPESEVLKELGGKWHQKLVDVMRQSLDPSRTRWYAMGWTMVGLEFWHRIFVDGDGREPTSSW
jgi:asparagine synthase (glutamine-hydrolysing)